MTIEQIKQLREKTQARLGDCKSALEEAQGNFDEAVKILEQKGQLHVARVANVVPTEGLLYSYIHQGKIGVMVEINCQTDFVARNEEFKQFVEEVALQIASMAPTFISPDDIGEAVKTLKDSGFRNQIVEQSQKLGKHFPLSVLQTMLSGKMNAWFSRVCLLNQLSVKYPDKTIKELMDSLSAKTGEKIVVKRFIRWELGESKQ